MRRRLLAWGLTVPLAVVGSQAAHWLAYRLSVPGGEQRTRILASTGHSYLAWAPAGIAVCTVLAACAFALQVRALTRGNRGAVAPSPWMLAALGPAIFGLQEHFERLAADGVFPWTAVAQRTFLIGLALHAPIVVAAYAAVRLVFRAATRVAALFARHFAGFSEVRAALPIPTVLVLRPGMLALGYPARGPPLHSI